ncbi:MHC class I antigen [Xyrichtys novacula]|uniref:MHC class I antigen n=1 Tax=Xyrichtys novacula TaxID=13765 RepID=A0AAV1HAK1_XYRNO|nr:MHC class I antigen [Xyrichtys novacula]
MYGKEVAYMPVAVLGHRNSARIDERVGWCCTSVYPPPYLCNLRADPERTSKTERTTEQEADRRQLVLVRRVRAAIRLVKKTSFRDEEEGWSAAKMFSTALLVLLWTGLTVNGEFYPQKHSLRYIYTAFSKPIELPGIHDFTAMGLLDNRMIDYYDSDHPKKIPKQDWMAEKLGADYWDKGTQSRHSKRQWFKVNIEILMDRMRQNNTDLHTLQWMHGCEGETQPDGSLKFLKGVDMYSYDGRDFLSFDDAHEVWVAPIAAAEPTKRKWDQVQVLKEYTRGYLEKECMDWLSKFMGYGQQQLERSIPPTVHVFAKNAKVKTNVVLTCFATGFLPKDIEMRIKMDGLPLTKKDGITSSGSLPNHDDTFQRRDSIEIKREELADYTCEVWHRASGYMVTRTWDKLLPPDEDSGSVIIIAVVLGGLFLVIGIITALVVLWKKGVIGGKGNSEDDRSSNSSNTGSNTSSKTGSGDVLLPVEKNDVKFSPESESLTGNQA